MAYLRVIVLLAGIVALSGCALGTVSRLNDLHQGMTAEQVKDVLGDPSGVQLINGMPVWRYSLHEYFVGWVPYYLLFTNDNQLVAWQANMNEYYANQQLMMSAYQSLQQSARPAGGGQTGVRRGGGGQTGGGSGWTQHDSSGGGGSDGNCSYVTSSRSGGSVMTCR